MSDHILRHLIAFLATFLFALTFWAAYISGAHGWWWTFLGIFVVYIIVYKYVDA